MAEIEQAELSSDEKEPEQLQANPDVEDNSEQSEQQEPAEFEVVLEGAEEPSAEEKSHKKPRGIKRLLTERRENRDEIAELRRENESLRQGNLQTNTQANAPIMPTAPTEESTGYDSNELMKANTQYAKDVSLFHQNNATQAARNVLDEQQNGTARNRETERVSGVLNAHYDRVEKLNIPDYDAVEGKLIEILDANSVSQIAQIVPNSEAVIYYLGKNPDEAFKIRQLWEVNPSGVLFKLGELSKEVKIVPKQNKQRPPPESKVFGSAPASKSQLEKQIDDEREKVISGEIKDLTRLNSLKGQLRRASA